MRAVQRVISADIFFWGKGLRESFPPLHDLGTHLLEAAFRLAVGEVFDAGDGVVGVFLGQGAGLLDAVALNHDISRLLNAAR
jgi:hypothetical protein